MGEGEPWMLEGPWHSQCHSAGGGTTAHRSKGLPTRCFIRMRASVRQLKGQDSATLLNRVSVEVQNA
jgi:hypothetical protein